MEKLTYPIKQLLRDVRDVGRCISVREGCKSFCVYVVKALISSAFVKYIV